jgi:hypothetical protein
MGRYLTAEPAAPTVTSSNQTTVPVDNLRSLDLLSTMLTTLKKIEYHLMIASDTNLNDEDV